jgi:hypothetical protein
MRAWNNLPNARYIDQLLADLKSHAEELGAAWDAAGIAIDGDDYESARNEALEAVWPVDRGTAWNAVLDATWSVARGSAWYAAWSAGTALIGWDHSAKYLSMTSEELEVWYALSDDPAALLLMPYARARELVAQKSRLTAEV